MMAPMDPEIRLEPHEARLLGVLVEKALTTPEQYPLSLNAAVNGANQKVNREPVLNLDDDEVAAALNGLLDKELARKVFPGNSRVDKYCHTGTSRLKIEIAQLALLAELLMRGPQTPAELRARASRMLPIDSAEALANLLDPLERRGMVERIPPGRGFRAERVAQCLCPGLHPLEAEAGSGAATAAAGDAAATRPPFAAQLGALEDRIARLERQLRALCAKLGETLDEQ